jgi:NAD dependent epimerase/dehydratase family enzyme
MTNTTIAPVRQIRIVLPGGNGHLGGMLARHFYSLGHGVTVFTRTPVAAPWRMVAWNGASLDRWAEELDGADVVINLAGRSVDCRYGTGNRREIMDSRIRLRLVRFGLGGAAGSGEQFVSWVHEADFVRAVEHLLAAEDVEGVVNVAAPSPLANSDFMRALRAAWGKRFGLSASEWMLEFGAVFLRTETELILKSRRVVPGRLLDRGFRFVFPEWPAAARDLVRRWSELHQPRKRANRRTP